MVFCTQCGAEASQSHRFCSLCGTQLPSGIQDTGPAARSDTSHDMPDGDSGGKVDSDGHAPLVPDEDCHSHGTKQAESGGRYFEDHVDRKNAFDDGMLVLTSRDLILYTSDETGELRRIPIASIMSHGYSRLKGGLVVQHMINQEEKLQEYTAGKQSDLSDLLSQKQDLLERIKGTRRKSRQPEILKKISAIEQMAGDISQEIHMLESDQDARARLQKQIAENEKTVFKLPSNYTHDSHTSRDEYRIWEYAIKRRTSGIPRIKVTTMPYDAIMTMDGSAVGATPMTMDKPLLAASILRGKYLVEICKEGYKSVKFEIATDIEKSYMKHVELELRTAHNTATDSQTRRMRSGIRSKAIDLSSCGSIMRKVQGLNEAMVVTGNEILVMSKDMETCYFEIPYGVISKTRYNKKIFGTSLLQVDYDEPDFPDMRFEFQIEGQGVSESEVRRQYESLSDLINKNMTESHARHIPSRVRPPAHFVVNERDIRNNFERFEPFEFEVLVARLFEKKGYKTTVTQKRGDFGVDVVAESAKEKIVIQVKHWKASVGGPDVHKTLGSMLTFKADRAMVVTTSDFTDQAREIQKMGSPVELWNGIKLCDEFRMHLLEPGR